MPGGGAGGAGGAAPPALRGLSIETRGLRVSLDGTEILKGIDLAVRGQRITGVIGPNGSGKSTLLKTFYKAIAPSGGEVLLDGEPVRRIPQKALARQLAVLPQQRESPQGLTVEETVFMGRYPLKGFMGVFTAEDREAVRDAMGRLDLARLADREFSSLSGGERQQVLLARALAQDTPWLLLDEPTNHLDIRSQLRILEFLKDLDKRIVVVFHDLSLASKYCDRLLVMKGGLIVADGTPEEVVTARLLSEVYGVSASIIPHPEVGRPVVIL
ncbi:MAG: ABC transporter ATP-binding protein [Deltaproteobacteria bacterium]|nr:ABC transporter ATP-binding protein [Deltaproteobacteria bacterium]